MELRQNTTAWPPPLSNCSFFWLEHALSSDSARLSATRKMVEPKWNLQPMATKRELIDLARAIYSGPATAAITHTQSYHILTHNGWKITNSRCRSLHGRPTLRFGGAIVDRTRIECRLIERNRLFTATGWTRRWFHITFRGRAKASGLYGWRFIVAFRFACNDQLTLTLTFEPIKFVLFITCLTLLYLGLDLTCRFGIVLQRTLLLIAIQFVPQTIVFNFLKRTKLD